MLTRLLQTVLTRAESQIPLIVIQAVISNGDQLGTRPDTMGMDVS